MYNIDVDTKTCKLNIEKGIEDMKKYRVKLWRGYGSREEYKTIIVYELSEVQRHCRNGWKCINYEIVTY